MVLVGIVLHVLGGFAAGSFYLPLKKVERWSWESAWLVNGVFSWILAPVALAWLTVPGLGEVLSSAPPKALMWTFLFGVLWGVGGLTFGLSVRYLGMSLGYAVVLGFCAAFGTLIPAVYDGSVVALLSTASGGVVLGGILVCLIGIGFCGYAGHMKEMQLSAAGATKREFNLVRGLLLAAFSGFMSAGMAFGFAAGKPIGERSLEAGTDPLWINNAVLVVILLGGFLTNALWCIYLSTKQQSWSDYWRADAPLRKNYLLSAIAGVMWYLQFMFYGMGSTKMGDYDFTSWTLHMSFIIIVSNLWSLHLKEWQDSGLKAKRILIVGVLVITLSTGLIGLGNYLQSSSIAH
tara:strand:+ start:1256 stop:2299 length:1044 start_codon:yes stop_codon:yes gene_type:complete